MSWVVNFLKINKRGERTSIRDQRVPAFKAMEFYFTNIKAKGFRGKPRATLPKVLNEDLNAYYNKDPIKAEHNYCHRLKLNTKEDLEELRALARD